MKERVRNKLCDKFDNLNIKTDKKKIVITLLRRK
jgi:hypothetical protein